MWALLHVPVVLLVYAPSIRQALADVPAGYRAALWPAFAQESVLLLTAAFLIGLPLSLAGRAYRFAAPALVGLVTVAFAVDSQVYRALGFHINGLVVRVLLQPGALAETGIPAWEVAAALAVAALWLTGEVWGGSAFLRRFAVGRTARPRPVLGWVIAIVLLAGVERVYVATLAFLGGPAAFAAGQVLPLQTPLRMNSFLAKVTGRRTTELRDRLGTEAERGAARLPLGIPAGTVRFTRRPDIVVVLIESLRADFFDSLTMPRLWRRAEQGSVFARHYASSSSTHYTLFSLFFGLQSQRLDAVIGSGHAPLLFNALKVNGYRIRLLAASSVDWMGMKATVFGDVQGDLETDYQGIGATRDSAMVAHAEAWVTAADTTPVFVMLFFDGTHFNYTYPPRSARFAPVWEGGSSVKAARVAPELILRRARNAAYEVDWKLDDFLARFAQRRGRAPLVMVTGDHGEEFREHGHIAHGSGVTNEQIHVPMVVLGEGVPRGSRTTVTSHIDVVPTLLGLLGDTHAPQSYADGISMFAVPRGRFVLSTVGWEPKYAAIGESLKVAFSSLDAGFGGVTITDPWDRAIPDGEARLAAEAANILRAFVRDRSPASRPAPDTSSPR
jgi:hypothetical protein